MEYLVTFADDTVEHILPGVLRLHFENGDISIDVREQSFAHLIDSGKKCSNCCGIFSQSDVS